MKKWLTEIRTSALAVISLAVLLCGVYPLTVWVLDQAFFPAKANGSLIVSGGSVVGSSLIAQQFTGPRYFHPRPSAAGQGYDASLSGGSNLGPTSKQLVDEVGRRAAAFREENGLPQNALVPSDAVTASGSGLDPHISLGNAQAQVPRVARARGLEEAEIRRLVGTCVEGRDLGIFGEPRVNVLKLNLALDGNSHGR